MSIVSTTKMTSRQFLELGEDPPGVRLELVHGEVAVSPSSNPDHSYTVGTLHWILRQHVDAGRLGQLFMDVDTVLGPHDVRRPDILFVAQSRLSLVGKNAVEGPPDLCVEVLSPSSYTIDRIDKFEQYAAGGVAFYWIVDPDNQKIEAYRLENGTYVLCSEGRGDDVVHLPPFEVVAIPLSKLWRPRA